MKPTPEQLSWAYVHLNDPGISEVAKIFYAAYHELLNRPPVIPEAKPCDHASECYHKPHCASGSFDALPEAPEVEKALAWAEGAVVEVDQVPFDVVRFERNQAKILAAALRAKVEDIILLRANEHPQCISATAYRTIVDQAAALQLRAEKAEAEAAALRKLVNDFEQREKCRAELASLKSAQAPKEGK